MPSNGTPPVHGTPQQAKGYTMSRPNSTPSEATTDATPLTASEKRAAALAAKLPAGKAVRVQASKAPRASKATREAKVVAQAATASKAPAVHVRATVRHSDGQVIAGRRVWFLHPHPTKKGWVQGHTVVASREYMCEAHASKAGEGGEFRTTGPKVRAARVAPLAAQPAKVGKAKAKAPAKATKVASK